MRLGPIGFIALWYLFGTMIVRGSIIARQLKDKYLQLIAIYTVVMFVMEVIVAYADYQLSFYRNVIYIGILAGVLMQLPKIDEGIQKNESSHGHRRITELSRRSQYPQLSSVEDAFTEAHRFTTNISE
jgi:hypothetical protein